MSRKKNTVDKIIFLGDYFDCFETPDNETYFGIRETCSWLNKTKKELGDKAIWLLGNHDVAYLASYIPRSYVVRKNSFYGCSGYTRSKASEINKYLDPEFIRDLELCCKANGYVVSHAGFNYDHFQPLTSELENVIRLYDSWENEKHSFYHQAYHWIWNIGQCRGGMDTVGSPVWLDFTFEFVDIPEMPQIVGHTCQHNYRQKGNSYCIDANRTIYSILNSDKPQPEIYTVD